MRDPRILSLVLAGLLLAPGCGGPLGPGESLEELADARRLWAARGPDAYVFTYELNCFCGGPGIPPARITVVDGRVTGVLLPATDVRVPDEELADYPTVPDLFDDVEAWLARDPVSARTLYDPTLGHPVDVFVDFEAHVIDEELGFLVRDLAALAPLREG